MATNLEEINRELAVVFPGRPATLRKAREAGVNLQGFEDLLDAKYPGVGELVACCEDEMFAHLIDCRTRGVANPDFRKTGFYAPQWKAAGGWLLWKMTGTKVRAACHLGRKLYAASE